MGRWYKSYDKNINNTSSDKKDTKSEIIDKGNIHNNSQHDSPIKTYLESKTLKGLKGHNLYEVGRYFIRSLFMENLSVRASSLSFNFFLALFPAIIFLLTLIAYLPYDGLKTQFIEQLSIILPERTYKQISETIIEILQKENSSLLSFGFLLTVYFTSNSFHLLINSFNRRLANIDRVKQSWLTVRLKAIFIALLLSIIIIVFLSIVTIAYQIEFYMESNDWPLADIYGFLVELIKYILIAGLFLLGLSIIYYFAPSKQSKWQFISIGSLVGTGLSLLTTFTFTIYVNNFDSYNKVYGSIGAIMALMVLLYINILSMIIGFELNTSIDKAELKKQLQQSKNQ